MAVSTIAKLKLFVGGANGVSTDILTAALDQAQRHVVREGLSESHNDFEDLQNAWAAHLLELQGAINSSSIKSKSVGDVSTEFAESGSSKSWLDHYRTIRQQVIGFSGRLGNRFDRLA